MDYCLHYFVQKNVIKTINVIKVTEGLRSEFIDSDLYR